VTSPFSLSVVVPVYNAERSLGELVQRLLGTLKARATRFEIVLVNDGSRDSSWRVITELASAHPEVRGIALMRNYGQQNALLAGIRAAREPIIVTLDDDLQHPPEEIPRLLDALEGHDVVYGAPDRHAQGMLRGVASYSTKLVLQGAVGVEVARQASPFRAFRTAIRDAFAGYTSPAVSIDVLLSWAASSYAIVRVRHDARRYGRSNYDLRRLAIHTLDLMTGFSTLPLQIASLLGFALTLFGVAVLVYVLVRFIVEGGSVPGFPFLASIIAIFSGAQLFVLGIIGEYLARVHFRLMDKPTYVVKMETGSHHK